MKNLDVPSYFYLDSSLSKTEQELDREDNIANTVIYIKLKQN